MKISRVRIRNFKSLKSVTLEGLKGGVVLAGPNGCGKSSIFDAIRLLKSAYGSYEQDEWQQWIGEFQITLRDTWRGLDVLFNDKKIPIEIEASFFFSQEELAYIKSNLSGIVEERYWIRHNRSRGHDARESMHRFSLEENGPHLRTITTETLQVAKEVEKFLSQPIQLANVVITPEGRITSTPNALLQLVFTVYDSENLGVFDFHGAHRQYNRERIATVNLALRGGDER